MTTCASDVFMPPDTRRSPKVLTVLDGRLCPLKIQDEKIGYSGVEFWIVNTDIQPPLMEVKLNGWVRKKKSKYLSGLGAKSEQRPVEVPK
ncbi:hypothetical protein FXO37_14909 [Capsicum annuum]|nr:hypothetical protein FXO37_14909 [Capsicum annuum]